MGIKNKDLPFIEFYSEKEKFSKKINKVVFPNNVQFGTDNNENSAYIVVRGVFSASEYLGLPEFTGSGGGGTLDQAYDFGGAGAGRAITVNAGAVQFQGSGLNNVFEATGSIDVLGTITASNRIVANLGFSGSLTRLANGTSYLVAGSNITITSSSNGQVVLNALTGSGGTLDQAYDSGGAGAGRTVTVDAGAVQFQGSGLNNVFEATGSIGVLGAITASNKIVANLGFSGSLTRLSNGDSYLVAGQNITVVSSSNGQVVLSGAPTKLIETQTFDVAGTYTNGWTKPPSGSMAMIICTGGGGGGAGGGNATTTNPRSGGCGGGGGAKKVVIIPLALLGSTEDVVVGASGSFSAGSTTSAADAGDGTASSFGSSPFFCYAGGGGGGRGGSSGGAAGQGGGGGGTGANGTVGGGASQSTNEGGPGLSVLLSTRVASSGGTGTRGGHNTIQASHAEWGGAGGGARSASSVSLPAGTSLHGGGGGGTGGGYNSSTSRPPTAGGSSGTIQDGGGGGAAGVNSTTAPTLGTDGIDADHIFTSGAGGGGGGGASNGTVSVVNGTVGGNGGFPGGAGGGGGCGANGTGGDGGSGASGLVIIYVW